MLRTSLLFAFAGLVVLSALSACPPSGAPTPVPPSPPPGSGYQSGAPVGAPCDTATDCGSGLCEGEGCGAAQGRCADPQRACTKDLRQYCGCDGQTFQASGSCPGARYERAGACEAAGKPDGAACLDGAECAGGTCEGQGCGDDAPGVCVSSQRVCTMDLRQYCGCDGQTFNGSGSCPNRRYASKGACAPAAPKADGASCLDAGECASGVCEGQGCGPDAPGVCAPKARACTRDLRSYCGCDGQTFRGSGSCPGRRYAAKGNC